MSLDIIKKIFKELPNYNDWQIQILQINNSAQSETAYIGRIIELTPEEALKKFILDLSNRYVDSKKGLLLGYTDVADYTGESVGNTIYKFKKDNALVKNDSESFFDAIEDAEVEMDPFDMKAHAYLLKGEITIDNNQIPLKLISMQNPIILLKHKFWKDNGTFKELNEKILSLRTIIDVVILGDDIYMLTLDGERLFNLERSYKKICNKKIQEVISSQIVSNNEIFNSVASAGHNPRRFVAFSDSRLEQLKNEKYRREMAEIFSIPLTDNKFDTTKEDVANKVVKLLCNKGMVDPFKDVAVEVAAAKQWQ